MKLENTHSLREPLMNFFFNRFYCKALWFLMHNINKFYFLTYFIIAM